MRKMLWLSAALLLLVVTAPGITPEADALLEPPDPTGTGCQECGFLVVEAYGNIYIIDPACVPAQWASGSSGKLCSVVGDHCVIQDWCQYA